MEKEVSCANSRAVLKYVVIHNNGDLSDLLADLDPEIDHLPDPVAYLMDRNKWISCTVASKLYKRARIIIKDDMTAYNIGKFAVENFHLGYVQRIIIRTFWSTKNVLNAIQKINDRYNRNKKIEVVEIKGSKAIVRLHWHPGMDVSKDICLYNKGVYSSMPLIWGGKPVKVQEECCHFDGAPFCEYRLKWPARNRFYEIFSKYISSESVFEETVQEMEKDKALLEKKYEEVNLLNVRLQSQMVELKRSQDLLGRTEKLAFLGDLAARLAHELKNPLTPIRTFLTMLPQKKDDEDYMNNFHKIALEETERINGLISELLDLVNTRESKFEANSLHDLVDKMCLLVSPESNAKMIKVIKDYDPDIENVWLDSEKFKQIILNLLSNAVEFTPEQGKIEIITRKNNSGDEKRDIYIEIRDNGEGIPEDSINKIFNPYYTTKHRSEDHSGTGLGLFIAHQNVLDHGGLIEVKSKVNQGTVFMINLPMNPQNSIENNDST
ncbi:nitrogen regulation protein NR(II) [Thermodesulfobacteriota bacterium]